MKIVRSAVLLGCLFAFAGLTAGCHTVKGSEQQMALAGPGVQQTGTAVVGQTDGDPSGHGSAHR